MTTKEQYWKYTLIALLIIMGIILFREYAPFLSGFLGASTVYVLVRKQMFFLVEKKKIRKSLSATLILIEVLLIFLIPCTFAVWLLIEELHGINLNPTATIDTIQNFANLIKEKTGYYALSTDNLVKAAAYLPKIGQMLVAGVSSFALNSVILLFVLYFMLVSGKEMEKFFYDLLPFNNENKKDVLKEVNVMVKSNAIGIPLLAIIQGAFALIGYYLFDVPNPVLFAFVTCFATIIPVVGTMMIWFPLALYMGLNGDWPNAIGLTVYALIVISNVDNVVRLFLQKQLANIHPLITVFGVVIGLSVFGFWGVIFGPLYLSMFVLLLNIFKREYLDKNQ